MKNLILKEKNKKVGKPTSNELTEEQIVQQKLINYIYENKYRCGTWKIEVEGEYTSKVDIYHIMSFTNDKYVITVRYSFKYGVYLIDKIGMKNNTNYYLTIDKEINTILLLNYFIELYEKEELEKQNNENKINKIRFDYFKNEDYKNEYYKNENFI